MKMEVNEFEEPKEAEGREGKVAAERLRAKPMISDLWFGVRLVAA